MGIQYRASRKKEAKKRPKNSKGEGCVEIRYCDIPGVSKDVLRNMVNAKYRPVKLAYDKYKDLEERCNVASDAESVVSADFSLLPNPNPEPSAGLPSALLPRGNRGMVNAKGNPGSLRLATGLFPRRNQAPGRRSTYYHRWRNKYIYTRV
jgi:hypothetical protein